MRSVVSVSSRAVLSRFVTTCLIILAAGFVRAQSTVNVRIMAANLNGNTQSYQPFALRILQGLQPDVVAIQEFDYASTNGSDVNDDAAFREMLNISLGTNYVYYREPYTANGAIPNGIISRFPIVNSGSFADTVQSQPNRGFAWAQISIPGATNSLYVVSVHLLTTSAANRSAEATNLKALIQANFPANAWVVVAGDFNTGSRTESTTMTTFDSYLSDFPIPVDNVGNSDTSENRNDPHDYVLPSFNFTNLETATVLPSHSFPTGLVFDSAVYTPLSDVAPVLSTDSGMAQHMAVMKDFAVPNNGVIITNPPGISSQPQSNSVATGNTASFSVTATGTAPLSYQWLFNGTNISGATTNPYVLVNAQVANSGTYSVIVTNIAGSITSSNATLTVTNAALTITTPPQAQTLLFGSTATFNVSVTGTLPVGYQWLFNGASISGATTNPFMLPNVQTANAGNYSVIVTNIVGGVTSSPAALTVLVTNAVVFAQWNFNSVPADSNLGTGSTSPSMGTGTAAVIGGISASFVTGDTTLDPAPSTDNTAWTTTGYAASANNKSAGVQFATSTAGKQAIVIFWSQKESNTGGKYFRLQYSTNSGSTFTDFSTAITATTGFTAFTNNLSGLPGVANNPNFVFRIVAELQSTATGSGSAAYVAANTGSTFASTGTSRFDMVSVSGNAIIVGGQATLGTAAIAGGQLSFNVTGTPTAGYIVQASTDLTSNIWVPVFTNTSPFTFADTNLIGAQKFYRAIAQ